VPAGILNTGGAAWAYRSRRLPSDCRLRIAACDGDGVDGGNGVGGRGDRRRVDRGRGGGRRAVQRVVDGRAWDDVAKHDFDGRRAALGGRVECGRGSRTPDDRIASRRQGTADTVTLGRDAVEDVLIVRTADGVDGLGRVHGDRRLIDRGAGGRSGAVQRVVDVGERVVHEADGDRRWIRGGRRREPDTIRELVEVIK
jgi:hypothetical protein